MNIAIALKRLGLGAPESQVYLFLLQHGQSSAPHIQAALTMEKVAVYRALSELQNKQYIERFGETRNQQFLAQPLEKLLESYDNSIKELSDARNEVQEFMEDVLAKRHDLYRQHNIQIFEGVEGYRVWNDERLKSSVSLIREYGRNDFLEQFFAPEEVEPYMQAYIKRRVSKSIPIRILTDANAPVPERDRSNGRTLKESRAVPMPEGLDSFMSIFGNKVGFYSKQANEYFGIIIDDRMLSIMLCAFFDSLWSQGKAA
jgi:sugar-specific transcriptional regulator TrmB